MSSLDHLEKSLSDIGLRDIVARRSSDGWYGHAVLTSSGVVFVPERHNPESTELYAERAEPYPQTLEAFLVSVIRQAEKQS